MPKKKARKRRKLTRNSGEWTEARFWTFIRSGLRRLSMRWQPKIEAKNAARRPNQGSNKRAKWQYQCASCKLWFYGKETQVDHIKPVGTLQRAEDLPLFVERLFCEANGLQVLCTGCHDTRRLEAITDG